MSFIPKLQLIRIKPLQKLTVGRIGVRHDPVSAPSRNHRYIGTPPGAMPLLQARRAIGAVRPNPVNTRSCRQRQSTARLASVCGNRVPFKRLTAARRAGRMASV